IEIGLRVSLEATVERPGVAVVPARLMLDVARALPSRDATLELRSAEQDVEIVAGSATFHIRTLRAEDFPPLPERDDGAAATLPAAPFINTLTPLPTSASPPDTPPLL